MMLSLETPADCPYVANAHLYLVSPNAEMSCVVRRVFEGSRGKGFTSSCTMLIEVKEVVRDASGHLKNDDCKVLKISDWRYAQLHRDKVCLGAWSPGSVRMSVESRDRDLLSSFVKDMYRPLERDDHDDPGLALMIDDLPLQPRYLDLCTQMASYDGNFFGKRVRLYDEYESQLGTAFKEHLAMQNSYRDFKHEVHTIKTLSAPSVEILPRLVYVFDNCAVIEDHLVGRTEINSFHIPAIMMDVAPGILLSHLDGTDSQTEVIESVPEVESDALLPITRNDVEHIFQDLQIMMVKCWVLGCQFEDMHADNILISRNPSTKRIEVSLIDAGAFRFICPPPSQCQWLLCVPDFSSNLEEDAFSMLAEVFRNYPIATSLYVTMPTACFELKSNFPDSVMWRAIMTSVIKSFNQRRELKHIPQMIKVLRYISCIMRNEMMMEPEVQWWRRACELIARDVFDCDPYKVRWDILSKLDQECKGYCPQSGPPPSEIFNLYSDDKEPIFPVVSCWPSILTDKVLASMSEQSNDVNSQSQPLDRDLISSLGSTASGDTTQTVS